MIYKLWSEGKGPRFYYVGTVRRISHEARLEWQRQLEATTSPGRCQMSTSAKRNAGAA